MDKKMVLSWMEESFGEILGRIFALDDIDKYCERFKSFKLLDRCVR